VTGGAPARQARCNTCGAVQPATAAAGQPCHECGHLLGFAAAPVPRGPAGWCVRHPQEPTTGVCARCGAYTCTACDVSLSGIRYCEACRLTMHRTLSAPVAWEERRSIGRLRAWWRTTSELIVRPVAFFEQLDPHQRIAPAMMYGLTGTVLHQVLRIGMRMLNSLGTIAVLAWAAIHGNSGGAGAGQAFMTHLVGQGSVLLFTLLSPLLLFALYVTVSLMQHAALRLVRAGESGVGATMLVAAYSMGIGWVGLIPILGPPAFLVWWSVLMVIGTSRVHRCSTTRTLVILVPTLMLCVAPVAAGIAAIVLAIFA